MMRCIQILVVLTLLSQFSCSMKPNAVWNEGTIAVMADAEDWQVVQNSLYETFGGGAWLPAAEAQFVLHHVSDSEFKQYTRFRYLVLAGTLESRGRIGDLVKGVVSDSEIRKGVIDEKYYVFIQRNPWAKNQLMGILVARDLPTLQKKIQENRQFIYNIFDADYKRRLEQEIFGRGERKDIEKKMMSVYGWKIRIQKDTFIAQELPKDGFVQFRCIYPERWIFVRWIVGGDSAWLTPQRVIGERNRIGALYYGGDRVVNQNLFSARSIFLGRIAQITSGFWENEGKVTGGPFRNFTFYDPISRRIYMIDVTVFAANRDMLPYLNRLEVIARTFRTLFDEKSED